MTLEAIGAIGAVNGVEGLQEVAPAAMQPAAPEAGFGNWFAQELNTVNVRAAQADQAVRQLAAGEPVSLHDVMIKLEEAKLSFQLLAQVRNRVLEAYQEVMRTQV